MGLFGNLGVIPKLSSARGRYCGDAIGFLATALSREIGNSRGTAETAKCGFGISKELGHADFVVFNAIALSVPVRRRNSSMR